MDTEIREKRNGMHPVTISGMVMICLAALFQGLGAGFPALVFGALGLGLILRNCGMACGVFLVGLGVLFLLDTFYVLMIDESWPLAIIVVGFALLVSAAIRKRESDHSNHAHQSATTPVS